MKWLVVVLCLLIACVNTPWERIGTIEDFDIRPGGFGHPTENIITLESGRKFCVTGRIMGTLETGKGLWYNRDSDINRGQGWQVREEAKD